MRTRLDGEETCALDLSTMQANFITPKTVVLGRRSWQEGRLNQLSMRLLVASNAMFGTSNDEIPTL